MSPSGIPNNGTKKDPRTLHLETLPYQKIFTKKKNLLPYEKRLPLDLCYITVAPLPKDSVDGDFTSQLSISHFFFIKAPWGSGRAISDPLPLPPCPRNRRTQLGKLTLDSTRLIRLCSRISQAPNTELFETASTSIPAPPHSDTDAVRASETQQHSYQEQ